MFHQCIHGGISTNYIPSSCWSCQSLDLEASFETGPPLPGNHGFWRFLCIALGPLESRVDTTVYGLTEPIKLQLQYVSSSLWPAPQGSRGLFVGGVEGIDTIIGMYKPKDINFVSHVQTSQPKRSVFLLCPAIQTLHWIPTTVEMVCSMPTLAGCCLINLDKKTRRQKYQ